MQSNLRYNISPGSLDLFHTYIWEQAYWKHFDSTSIPSITANKLDFFSATWASWQQLEATGWCEGQHSTCRYLLTSLTSRE